VVRTALNVGVSWWRRGRGEVPLEGTAPVDEAVPPLAMDAGLLDAVRRLPGREREVVVMRLVLDMDTAATARQLGIAPGTVRAHLARAVSTLRLAVALNDDKEVERCPATTK
jgi:DNA-directed RNA polymerase specialized sigma24 family protein